MAFDYFETSAKTGTNVFAAFQKLAYHVTEICNPQVVGHNDTIIELFILFVYPSFWVYEWILSKLTKKQKQTNNNLTNFNIFVYILIHVQRYSF